MRTIARAFPLLAAACLAALPAHAQLPDSVGAQSVRIDPCTGKPYAPRGSGANRADPQPGTPSTGGTPSGMTHSGTAHSTATPSAATAPGTTSSATASPGATSPVTTPSATPSPGATSSGTATSGVTYSGMTSPGATSSGTQTSGATPSASGSPQGGPGSAFSAGGREADPEDARRYREALRLGQGATRGQVRLGPAASVSVPTAFGVDAGEVFLGVAYQGRTRYTELDDAAAVAGLGLGTRRLVAVEVALTTYSTFRGAPLETGGLSFKLHHALPRNTSVAVGWENALLWGGSDDRGSLYAVATRVVPLRRDPSEKLGLGVVTLGVGNGRFRSEKDDAEGNETVNVFAAAGLRVIDPLSLVADWTGQDLNVAASVTPFRRVPLVLTAGLADLTGSAGDGARFILSLGYGLSIRQPF
jgi:hypothetical protein